MINNYSTQENLTGSDNIDLEPMIGELLGDQRLILCEDHHETM